MADNDNIQSADQTGPDTAAVGVSTTGDKPDNTSAPDTDNVQSGEQTGPETEVSGR